MLRPAALAALLAVPLLALPALAETAPPPATVTTPHCAAQDGVQVPAAERTVVACLDDLTTAGTTLTGHTDQSDWAPLNARGTVNPTGVPGVQVDGYFPDTSRTNTTRGWNHDSQFVLRLPDRWNGGLVVTGAPGVRKQYANDFIISDWVLSRGYAFASTDKGNTGTSFYNDGVAPGDAVAEWHERVTQLTVAAKEAVAAAYGQAPRRTLMTGISNGGYLTRWQLENRPELYDGAVDWEGTLFRADGPNLFTYLPTAMRDYPAWRAGDETAHQRILAAGMPAGSEFLWDYHEAVYWDLTQRVYREEFDPGFDGALAAGVPFCLSGTPSCDADYDYASRPQAVKDTVARISLTGRIGKPMLTLHGDLDALLPPAVDSDVYTQMVADAGRAARHRYYRITGGNHVDSLVDTFPEQLRPILPCYREAFLAMERWLDHEMKPPASHTVPRQGGDEINTCDIASAAPSR